MRSQTCPASASPVVPHSSIDFPTANMLQLNGHSSEEKYNFSNETNLVGVSNPIEPPQPPPKRISKSYLRTVLDRPRSETTIPCESCQNPWVMSQDRNSDPIRQTTHLYPSNSIDASDDPLYPNPINPYLHGPQSPLHHKCTALVEPTVSNQEVFYCLRF